MFDRPGKVRAPDRVLRMSSCRRTTLPNERTFPFTKEWRIYSERTGNLESILANGIKRKLSYVVSIIKRHRASTLESQHPFNVLGHRME